MFAKKNQTRSSKLVDKNEHPNLLHTSSLHTSNAQSFPHMPGNPETETCSLRTNASGAPLDIYDALKKTLKIYFLATPTLAEDKVDAARRLLLSCWDNALLRHITGSHYCVGTKTVGTANSLHPCLNSLHPPHNSLHFATLIQPICPTPSERVGTSHCSR